MSSTPKVGYWSALHHPTGKHSHRDNTQYEQLLEAARRVNDPVERLKFYQAADRLLMQEAAHRRFRGEQSPDLAGLPRRGSAFQKQNARLITGRFCLVYRVSRQPHFEGLALASRIPVFSSGGFNVLKLR